MCFPLLLIIHQIKRYAAHIIKPSVFKIRLFTWEYHRKYIGRHDTQGFNELVNKYLIINSVVTQFSERLSGISSRNF